MSRLDFPLAAALSVVALVAPLSAGAAPVANAPTATTQLAPAKLKSVTLHIFNRVFEGFHDKVVALPNREFRIGDTEYTARIIRFVPDFSMDIKTHKIISYSGDPKNPAFQIVVSRKGAARDTSWAFFNMPPHFSARAELAFVATQIEFMNRPTLASNDSIAIKIQQREGGAR